MLPAGIAVSAIRLKLKRNGILINCTIFTTYFITTYYYANNRN